MQKFNLFLLFLFFVSFVALVDAEYLCTGSNLPNTVSCIDNSFHNLTPINYLATYPKQLVYACNVTNGQDTPPCSYVCAPGFLLSGGSCVTNYCRGTPPENTVMCSNDATGLVGYIDLSFVSTCSDSKKCE